MPAAAWRLEMASSKKNVPTAPMPTSESAPSAALREQDAYARRVAAFGLRALLEPYTVRPVPVVPSQRRRVVRSEVTA